MPCRLILQREAQSAGDGGLQIVYFLISPWTVSTVLDGNRGSVEADNRTDQNLFHPPQIFQHESMKIWGEHECYTDA